jgi:proline iminopeptidase
MSSYHHLPRLGGRPEFPARIATLSRALAGSRVVYRWLFVIAVAGLSGFGVGLAMPRGPVTSGQALALLVVSVVVGLVAGWVLRSRWAMLIAPVAQIVVFELTRLGASGPTVDGISIDGTFGPLAFIVGRGFYGLVGTLPMIVAAIPRRLSRPE